MTILPVIDILHGVTVRGVAGRRDDYRPLQSRWSVSADPKDVANGLQQGFGFHRFYVADLDGILEGKPNHELYCELHAAGHELLVDAGIQTADDARFLLDAGVTSVIAGLESLRGPDELAKLISRHGPERIIFSLDLRSGAPQFAPNTVWPKPDVLSLAETAVKCGVRQMIVLDLADVGVGTGGSTAAICREILRRDPELRVITGGGIRSEDDVHAWAETGITELLIASALHDGRLSTGFVRDFG